MQKHITFLLIFLLACILPRQLAAQELPLRHFTTENEINPLPGPAITSVFQDSDGFIWFAVYGTGLVRYDGQKMEVFTHEDGLSPYIFSITQDVTGRLWLGEQEGISVSGLPLQDYKAGERISFVTELDGLSLTGTKITSSNQLLADSQGNIWSSDMKHILRYNYGENKALVVDSLTVPDHPQISNYLYSFVEKRNGDLAAMSFGEYLVTISATDFSITTTHIPFQSGIVANHKYAIDLMEASDRSLWGVSNNGLVWSYGEDGTRTLHNEVSTTGMRQIMQTREGSMLAGTLGNGLLEWKNEVPLKPRRYTLQHGMLSTAIWDFIQDNEGSIWLATNAGLSRMRNDYNAFGHFTASSVEGAPNMLAESAVNGVCSDIRLTIPGGEEGERFIAAATSSGLSIIRNDGTREILQQKDGLLNAILNVHQDGKDRIWVTSRNGINCISEVKALTTMPGFETPRQIDLWDKPHYITSLPLGHFSSLTSLFFPTSDTDPTLLETNWFMGGGMVLALIGDQWMLFFKESGINANGLRSIALDDQNILYLGDGGTGLWKSNSPLNVSRLLNLGSEESKNKRYKGYLNVTEEVFSRRPITIEGDTIGEVTGLIYLDSILWASTNYGVNGINMKDWTTTHLINEEDGLFSNAAAGIILNRDSTRIWASTRDGYHAIDPKTGTLTHSVKQEDGLVSSRSWGHPGAHMNSDGVMYMATVKGLSVYNPALDQRDTVPPTVQWRNFDFMEDHSGNNELLIEYAALSFTHEQGIRYKTKLVGYDEDWSEEKSENGLRYTNLPAVLSSKEYSFEVLAGDDKGNWMQDPKKYTFAVSPPWYLHWLAVLLYTLVLFALVYGYTRWRERALKARQKLLEKTVDERTAEIVKQKDVILKEKERSEELLLNILPAEVAEELKLKGESPARNFDQVTVLFTDIKEFTMISEQLSATELVAEINVCFQAFDEITSKFKIEKIKTIGDAYLAAGGLHLPRKTEPKNVVLAALAMQKFVQERHKVNKKRGVVGFEMRCGIHTGPVVAGIVGIKKFQYDIWGDTVNTASRIESNGEVGKVNISQLTYELIKDDKEFTFKKRGKFNVKGKGEIAMYFVSLAS